MTWYNSNWPYRKTITISGNKVSGNISNYPMLWHSNSDSDLSSHASSNGHDIIFVDDDDSGPLSPTINKRERTWNIYNPISKHLIEEKYVIAYILKRIEDGKPINSSVMKQLSQSTSIKSNLLKQLYRKYDIKNPFVKSNLEIYKELKSKTKHNKLIKIIITM